MDRTGVLSYFFSSASPSKGIDPPLEGPSSPVFM